MSLLRTNPIHAALWERSRNRRISAGFIVEAAAGASALHVNDYFAVVALTNQQHRPIHTPMLIPAHVRWAPL